MKSFGERDEMGFGTVQDLGTLHFQGTGYAALAMIGRFIRVFDVSLDRFALGKEAANANGGVLTFLNVLSGSLDEKS